MKRQVALRSRPIPESGMRCKYSVVQGGIGLAADVSAHTEESGSAPSRAIQRDQRLHLRLPAGHIHRKDAARLAYGLPLHAAELSRNAGGHPLVVIDSFAYPGADHQAEVAAPAIDGWVHQNPNTPPCGIPAGFDRSRRKSCFDRGPGMAPFRDDLAG
ncbi:hypothetical protein OG753_19110 [Streptomyces sp. NBC_00029]|uniref:hypothetical protein n=1 Tax=Streptomyces sp. NBC_00029 TaxID=2903613 RepID=UPI00324F666E